MLTVRIIKFNMAQRDFQSDKPEWNMLVFHVQTYLKWPVHDSYLITFGSRHLTYPNANFNVFLTGHFIVYFCMLEFKKSSLVSPFWSSFPVLLQI